MEHDIKHTRKRYSLYKRDKFVRNKILHIFHCDATAGILLFIATVIAMIFANFPQLGGLNDFWDKIFSINFGDFELSMDLRTWINDGFMAVFFFVVGLEIKREMLVGELSSIKQSSLPIAAALGGMMMPALIYFLFNMNSPETASGWGIPMATDIAFAIGVLSLLGKRVPLAAKVFLVALAIADDLGAIVVIAVFYPSHALHLDMLMFAGIIMAVVIILNNLRIRHILIYITAGILLWYVVLQSGIHATISGVLLALIIPAHTRIDGKKFYARASCFIQKFRAADLENKELLASENSRAAIAAMKHEIEKVSSPMQRFELGLHGFALFVIMPMFALANAGVALETSAMSNMFSNVSMGVIFGLLFGKPIGIFIFGFIVIKLGLAKFSQGMNWSLLLGVGIIAGIGFTMSMFVANLAFANQAYIDTAKIAIFVASITTGVLGSLYICLIKKQK